jgi:uncharacterized protein YkwD
MRQKPTSTMALAFVVGIGLCAASCGDDNTTGPGPSGPDPENNLLLNGVTAAHNNVRATVKPAPSTPLPPLQWDETVALAAQNWANNCMFAI